MKCIQFTYSKVKMETEHILNDNEDRYMTFTG